MMMSLGRPNPFHFSIYPVLLSKYVSFFPRYPLPVVKFSFLKCSQLRLCSSMEAPPPGYRNNVGICVISSSKKIFSASRLDIPSAWQMPQGGIDDEDPKDAAIRELREETGISSVEILAEVPYWLTYEFPPEVREKLNKLWGADWKGQAQKWFLFKFVGKEEEINLSGDGTGKPEFGEWSWMTPHQIIEFVTINLPVLFHPLPHAFAVLPCLRQQAALVCGTASLATLSTVKTPFDPGIEAIGGYVDLYVRNTSLRSGSKPTPFLHLTLMEAIGGYADLLIRNISNLASPLN